MTRYLNSPRIVGPDSDRIVFWHESKLKAYWIMVRLQSYFGPYFKRTRFLDHPKLGEGWAVVVDPEFTELDRLAVVVDGLLGP